MGAFSSGSVVVVGVMVISVEFPLDAGALSSQAVRLATIPAVSIPAIIFLDLFINILFEIKVKICYTVDIEGVLYMIFQQEFRRTASFPPREPGSPPRT